MATLTIGGKTVVTQTGTDEPIIGSDVVFPAGHIIQVSNIVTLNPDTGSTSITGSYATYLSNSITVTLGNNVLILLTIDVFRLTQGSGSSNLWNGPQGFLQIYADSTAITREIQYFQRDNISATKYMNVGTTIHHVHTPTIPTTTYHLQAKYGTTTTGATLEGVKMVLMEIQR